MRATLIATMLGIALSLATAGAAPIQKGQVSRSDLCGECHRDIYKMWRASAHAAAMEDPIFLEAYRSAESREGAAVSRVCLTCHAPVVELNKDVDLKQKITWEGVNCDVCHSIASVDTTHGATRLVLDVGTTKRGPIKDAASTAHETSWSALHTQVLACAPCHEYTNAEGTPIMTTYTEWKRSSIGRSGTICQNCHMSQTKANVVDPVVSRVPDHEVNLHEVPGGHSLGLLNKALKVDLSPRREGDSLVVEVRLKNRGAGHAVPTGMPGRHVIMALKVSTSQGASYERKRTYGKTYVDARGNEITLDSSYFASGVRLVADNRIQPDEQRVEQFSFPLAPAATAYVSIKLHYEHAPNGTDENRTWLTFYSDNQTLAPSSGGKR